ncbi:OTU deubiquitinase with linear linkage specificity a [Fundulus heteroclitus]|uniref:OTU deubiquitinase with linear linkage specificity a n=1 Tax=Fundulus heteroclitus TaxID=8078 RepID=UPI00165BD6A2|nr:OTU deubiquitinase with linear linkage specificity a [Fundulus heteroclitus]
MSWVKAASLGGEDVFDDTADDLSLQSKEWTSNMKKRIKDGYVDGVNAGEEASLQEGFNQGFREGSAQTVAVGRLRGIVSAVWCWCQIQHPEQPAPSCVVDLLQRATRLEQEIVDGIRSALENPPPSVSDVSESMEDLEVRREEPGCQEMDCCRSEGETDHQQNPCGSDEGLDVLVQRCVDVASELGLPQELMDHIEELRSISQSA